MKRVLSLAVSGLVLLPLAACGRDSGPLETRYELTGDSGATVRPTVQVLDENGKANRSTSEQAALPWSRLLVAERGETVLEATPSKGALTCRIVVEGTEVAKVTGAPGKPVTCTARVDE